MKEISKDYDEAEFLLDFFKREYRNLAPVILNYTNEYDILMNLDPEHKDFYRTVTKK